MYIAPGGLFWNASNSLSVSNFTFEGGSDTNDDLVVTFNPPGDGVLDRQDACPNSIVTATVVIDGCDSAVPNTVLSGGCTIADKIAQCAANASNHGEFVSCVAHLTNELKEQTS
ncbi:MAG: hypothetical protein AABN33_02690 [Acidobacteriota bacterium]